MRIIENERNLMKLCQKKYAALVPSKFARQHSFSSIAKIVGGALHDINQIIAKKIANFVWSYTMLQLFSLHIMSNTFLQ
jgi:hypothetical protein